MQVTNLSYFYERSKKVRGGKWVWVKDSNGEQRGNVLLGGTILNPKKGFDHLYAGQLVQYTPAEGCLIFRSFKVLYTEAGLIEIAADGYSDVPEVGMYLMAAPNAANTSGDYIKVASVTQETDDIFGDVFVIEFDEEVGFTDGDILVEADAAADAALAEPTGKCKVLVPNPNTFIEADRDLMPTEGYGIENANYSISTVYNKQAWIERMQPLPEYVLANNRSLIAGIFWI